MVDQTAYHRIIAIGDIHGCVHALDALLEAIRPTKTDLIVSLGDFIDTGRETREVIDRLLSLRKVCQFATIMGNHEQMMLGAFTSERLKDSWLMCGGYATLNSYVFGADLRVIPEEHLELVRTGKNFLETDTHFFVHAGYEANLPLTEQPEHMLRWSLLGDPSLEPHESGKIAIVGHTEQRSGEILDLGHVVCIDTYCHGYGWLTAVDVLSGEVWQASRWGALREGESLEGLRRAKKLLHEPPTVGVATQG